MMSDGYILGAIFGFLGGCYVTFAFFFSSKLGDTKALYEQIDYWRNQSNANEALWRTYAQEIRNANKGAARLRRTVNVLRERLKQTKAPESK